MDIICLDNAGCLFLSPKITDWKYLDDHRITVVIDLEGELDHGVPTIPNHILYIYFPIYDEDLPDTAKLLAVARMGASLVKSGHRVLSHCGMGFNRSALVAGLILMDMGMSGPEVVSHLRSKRPGALFNEVFARYLEELDGLP
ncbi:MAG TPA: dual specificity protein phosphatase [Thermoanaerobaculia bacterium]|nr:dual specificity protein phosphatase [Thermoanaerobaculia bacterium]